MNTLEASQINGQMDCVETKKEKGATTSIDTRTPPTYWMYL